ncbi:EAL domain-containing protein [Mobilitalea sibirica]|uniref:EAL domain-containing protein n=1 Tax=Mobilitalea sibirica TaxID=1462919 RepID=A0A8J7H055_9FIRM|nr:ABC transporter substrate binding protein [Mobilitalea sibirica]MBH1939317.1 EAL domain-containing protein [Mobilitalea sibirica]
MIKKKIKYLRIVTIIVTFCLGINHHAFAKENGDIKSILILNSYHQGFVWTQEATQGIMDKFREKGDNVSFFIEYMDWKNYQSHDNLDYLYDYYKYKYHNKKIDVIVTTDDIALQFALNNRENIFSDAPIVFCGVNSEGVRSITEGFHRVTGVVEVIDPIKTLKIASKINPSIHTVYLLNDNSESGISTGNILIEKIEKFNPDMNVITWNDLSFDEIKHQAQALDENSIIIIGTYFSDGNNNVLDIAYATKEISNFSNVPVYSLYDFGLNNGIIGGSLLSGRLQGEYAADMANRILEGEDPDKIRVMTPDSTRVVFDYNQLIRFDIDSQLLPKDYEIINKPFSFYETYKVLVLSVVFAFIILISFVSILLFYLRKIQRMKKNLSENHEELTQLYEELTASDDEMRHQYEALLKANEKIKENEEKLAYLAYYDSRTGLPNKLSLYETANNIFTSEEKKAALLFLDIDNFKYVNDTLGHVFGDKLIVKISERLTSLLWKDCTFYRLSGDEFIIILQHIENEKQAEEYASYLLNNFMNEFDSLNSNLHISMSIGISIYPDHGNDLENLLKYADIAMYQAKKAGKKNYVTFNDIMHEDLVERISIEKYLEKALEHNEFELHYQPQLDIRTETITGFEALLRWNSPDLGAVSPIKFIKVAEETHFINQLGEWVLNKACGFLKRVREKGYSNLTVSVNISILQLLNTNFQDIVKESLQSHQLEPKCLELEITESILMESFDFIASRLQELRDINVGIALDDFGKGYSSLNYLKQLPITTMKIDKIFIDHIAEDSEDDFVGHIISIGKNMGMNVIAEGVEVQNQFNYLKKHNCDKIQGFLFCHPIPEADIFRLLEENQ